MAHRWLAGLKRRDILAGLGVAGTAALTGVLRQPEHPATSRLAAPARGTTPSAAGTALPNTEVRTLFGPLATGARIDRWHVVKVHSTRMGAIAVVLATEQGERFQVDVHRRDGAAGGIAGIGNSPSLSCYLLNRGDGATTTQEEHGLGAMALADALAEREAAGAPVPALLTLRERNRRYPAGVFSVNA